MANHSDQEKTLPPAPKSARRRRGDTPIFDEVMGKKPPTSQPQTGSRRGSRKGRG